MSPTLLVDARGPAMCVGGSGGPWIISDVTQAIVNLVDKKLDAARAVAAPRLHTQLLPPVVYAEPSVPEALTRALGKLGHEVKPPRGVLPPAVQAIRRVDAGWDAGSDPRKGGAPASY
jgi:gamma-glutamyltranspeptidase